MDVTTPEGYIEARVSVPREMADAVCNFVIDNIAGGIVLEEEDESPITQIVFYVSEDKLETYHRELPVYLADVFEAVGQPVPEVREKSIRNVEWVDEYKKSIQPVRIAGDVVVRPHWHGPLADTRYDILLEPKMAFGTGTHETTRSCLAIIRERFSSGMRFLDLGAGSGILSILASKMGAGYIKAIDYDLAAVQNCKENFEINKVMTPHHILFGSIEKAEHDEPYDFICANIIKSTILPMLSRLVILAADQGLLVLSGLLQQDEQEVSDALRELGQSNFEIVTDNKWLTYVMRK
jgi:ribosomal protein L11 methyltransferase